MAEFQHESKGFRPSRLFWPIAVLFLGVPEAAAFYIDQRWYQSLGYAEIFSTTLATKLALGVMAAALVGLSLFVNLRISAHLCRNLTPLYLHNQAGLPQLNLSQLAMRVAPFVCGAASLLAGLVFHRHWSTFIQFANASTFPVRDPIFEREVGFYVLRLPFYEAVCSLCLTTIIASTVLTAALYTVRGAIVVNETQYRVLPGARRHLSVLCALLLLAFAARTYLDMFGVLRDGLGPMAGASYADVHATLPAMRIQIGLAAVSAVLILASAAQKGFGLVIAAAALLIASQLGVQVYPRLLHRFSVKPNELERESPFLQYNIEATRAAYGLHRVVERNLDTGGTLTQGDIVQNRDTIDNVRLWDHQPLLDTFAQIQEIRTYYDFASVDNDRYVIDGDLRQTMISARELGIDSVPNPTWLNKRFTFTHGYGLALGPVNEATPEGMPVLFVQDIPPVSNTKSLSVTRPAIYFGELSSDHVFVRTRNHEFDYPSADGNVQTDYDGKDGIRFDSALMRLLLAIKLGSIELLLSDDIDSDSRVLLHRSIEERLRRVAPFLVFDNDPYLVVREDGTLSWICDAYTTSTRYPYAEPASGQRLNYIRNSVKAVVDAYDGTVTLYAVDDKDPILRTWRRAFPQSFTPLSKMPKDLRAHLRYPEKIFDIQTEMFTVYHMTEAELLYNREDQWEVPTLLAGESKVRMEPYYTIMKLPGEQHAEFILMLPFTPRRKDNLAAWMVARSDEPKRGELIVYRFPKDRLIYGPQQIVTRINQDPEIARQISLWDQRGSKAEFGNLLVIPIESSLLYVRPLYLRSAGGKIPELKRVVVVYEKQIAMKTSLREALDAIFKSSAKHEDTPSVAALPAPLPSAQDTPTKPPTGSIAARTLQHFERAIAAQRAGNWTAYGTELQNVEHLLQEMAKEPIGP